MSAINIDILYHIASFCDFPTQLNIKKLCSLTNNSYKIHTDDPIYPLRKELIVIYNKIAIGSIYVTNNNIDTMLKKIVCIRNFISKKFKINNEITFDIMLPNGKKKNYKCVDIDNKIEININHKSKFLYPNCIAYNGPRQYFTICDNGIFHGRYCGTPYAVAKKICAKLFQDKKNIDKHKSIDFSFMRITDGKCFYYTGTRTSLPVAQTVQMHTRNGNKNVIFRYRYNIRERNINYKILMGNNCANNNNYSELCSNNLDRLLQSSNYMY